MAPTWLIVGFTIFAVLMIYLSTKAIIGLWKLEPPERRPDLIMVYAITIAGPIGVLLATALVIFFPTG